MSIMNGSVKSLILPLAFAALSLLSIPARAGEKMFSSLDYPKAKGINISFKYPDHWELREAADLTWS